MITVNLNKIENKHFPDGTQMLLDVKVSPIVINGKRNFDFYWRYENDEELVTIMYLVKHFNNFYPDCHMVLSMPFVPNARMDRVKNYSEVFTLKWFCEIINYLNFDEVVIFDPHSHVCEGVLDRVKIDETRLNGALENAIDSSECNLIYFPDAGALKRYGDLKPFEGFKKVYGQKNRDWKTGTITGLSILSDDGDINELVAGANVLMVDDIISYGGTMYFSSLKLKELGAKEINAYASHTENSILNDEKSKFLTLLNDGTVKNLYTTKSLFNGKHDKIKFV